MPKKIYLIYAPTTEKTKNYPFNLVYLYSYLKKNGFNSEILDCNVLKWRLKDLLDYLEANRAEFVGITSYTHNRFYTYNAIREIKSRLPECRIIAGGCHFSSLAVETLQQLKEVDFVVRGEGEITLIELCGALYNKKSVKDILGITYRENGKIISNPDRPLASNLEDLQYNLADLTNIKGDYSLVTNMRRFPASKGFLVMAGRGCVGGCVFCCLASNKIRLRKSESILDEIEQLIKITGIRNVSFIDPTLTANKKHLVLLCEGILRKKLNIKWGCYSRADVPSEIFELMKRAGCISVDIALESASPRVLQAIKKNIRVEDVLRCIKKLHRLEIKSFVYAMISLPDEREEDAKETLRFLEETSDLVDGSTLAITEIFPDAELYNIAKEKNLLPPGFNWFENYHNGYYDRNLLKSTTPFYIEHLSFDYIKKMIKRFEKLYMQKFYDRYTFKEEFRRALVPFIFDWKNQTMGFKARKLKNGFRRLPYIFKLKPGSKV